MGTVHGRITDRLLRLLSAGKIDNSAIQPGRPADVQPKRGKVPRHVEGHGMTGRGKSKKK